MHPEFRELFDRHLELVLPELPESVHRLIDEVPLVVEDYPSAKQMRKVGVRRRHHLCGLYTGVPLTDRSVMQSGIPSDVIHIFREGILSMATDRSGQVDTEELQKQIRITILHELGHHHGLSEDDLRQLGY